MSSESMTPKMAAFLTKMEHREDISSKVLSRYWRAFNLGWIELFSLTPDEAEKYGIYDAAICQAARDDDAVFVGFPPTYQLTTKGRAELVAYRRKQEFVAVPKRP